MAIQGDRLPAAPNALEDVILYPVAMEIGLPPTDGTPGTNVLKVDVTIATKTIVYKLHPNCIDHTKPGAKVVYYIAYNTDVQRCDFVVGPNLVDRFADRIFVFAMAAYNFYGFLGNPSEQEVKSACVGYLALNGQYSAALRMLGKAWLAALQDPGWWMQTLGSVAALEAPAARGAVKPRAGALNEAPPRAPALSENTGPVRGGSRVHAADGVIESETPLAKPKKPQTEPDFLPELQENLTPPKAKPAEVAANLGRGNFGERQAAFALEQDGHTILSFKPDVAGTNQPGIDIVTLKNGKVYAVDNKALTRTGNVSSVSALDTNYAKNIASVRQEFAGYAADATRPAFERNLFQQAVDAIDSGKVVKAVTNANFAPDTKLLSGVSAKLQAKGFQFIDVMR